MRVLPADAVTTPPLTCSIEHTDPGLARDVPLYPRPARRPFPKPVEQDHGRRSRTRTPQVQAVTVNEIGMPIGGRVAGRRCLSEGLECAAEGKEPQERERGIQKRSTRPVVQ